MFNPFETQQIEEFIPNEYEDYMDHFRINIIPEVTSSNIITLPIVGLFPNKDTLCPKCGETITEFELDINDNICPCCGSDLSEDDIPI